MLKVRLVYRVKAERTLSCWLSYIVLDNIIHRVSDAYCFCSYTISFFVLNISSDCTYF